MASPPTSPPRQGRRLIDRIVKANGKRPHSIRTQSEAQEDNDLSQPYAHARHKSTATPAKLARLSITPTSSPRLPFSPTYSSGGDSPASPRRSIESFRDRRRSDGASLLDGGADTAEPAECGMLLFDFSKIDYQLDRARKLGSGLWSEVFLCEPRLPKQEDHASGPTPPESPRKRPAQSPAAVFAVKVPARRDSVAVLRHEGAVSTHIQSFAGANQYMVPFFGLDSRNSSLVFEAVVGGSLNDLVNRLKHMTELARHEEVVSIFPGICSDLIGGLAFLHDAEVVHADIKPMNILLDVSDHYSLPAPVIRARYIDFSSAFILGEDAVPNAGGTWEFMAPEQIAPRAQPSFASDVWGLGITLLVVILLDSPYRAACGDNLFMTREAIKSGDPLSFARMDLIGKDRMTACQEYIDWCRVALQKDVARRITAGGWRRWLELRTD